MTVSLLAKEKEFQVMSYEKEKCMFRGVYGEK